MASARSGWNFVFGEMEQEGDGKSLVVFMQVKSRERRLKANVVDAARFISPSRLISMPRFMSECGNRVYRRNAIFLVGLNPTRNDCDHGADALRLIFLAAGSGGDVSQQRLPGVLHSFIEWSEAVRQDFELGRPGWAPGRRMRLPQASIVEPMISKGKHTNKGIRR